MARRLQARVVLVVSPKVRVARRLKPRSTFGVHTGCEVLLGSRSRQPELVRRDAQVAALRTHSASAHIRAAPMQESPQSTAASRDRLRTRCGGRVPAAQSAKFQTPDCMPPAANLQFPSSYTLRLQQYCERWVLIVTLGDAAYEVQRFLRGTLPGERGGMRPGGFRETAVLEHALDRTPHRAVVFRIEKHGHAGRDFAERRNFGARHRNARGHRLQDRHAESL